MVQGYHGGQSTVRHALQDFPVVIQCVLIPVIGSWLNTAPFNGQAVRILSSFHRPVQVLLPPPSPPITGKPGSIPIPNPSFLLLDEPFACGDPIAGGEIRGLVHGLKARGIGVLITDHNVRETLGILDRAYILRDGGALMDGATPLQTLWHIILPLAKPALATVAIFTFQAAWNDFLGPLIFLHDQQKYTIMLGLSFFRGAYTVNWAHLMAASIVVSLPVILVYVLAQRQFIQGIAFTVKKG